MEVLMSSTLETTEKYRYRAPGALHSPPCIRPMSSKSLECNPNLESLQSEALITAALPDVFTSKKYINVVIILTNAFSPFTTVST